MAKAVNVNAKFNTERSNSVQRHGLTERKYNESILYRS